jgi:hypothetical protein
MLRSMRIDFQFFTAMHFFGASVIIKLIFKTRSQLETCESSFVKRAKKERNNNTGEFFRELERSEEASNDPCSPPKRSISVESSSETT